MVTSDVTPGPASGENEPSCPCDFLKNAIAPETERSYLEVNESPATLAFKVGRGDNQE